MGRLGVLSTMRQKTVTYLDVHPKGFEPLSVVPETTILSIELRVPSVWPLGR